MSLTDWLAARVAARVEPVQAERVRAVETHVTALYDELRQLRAELKGVAGQCVQLRTDEARRAAEHLAMVDTLTRLYKRVTQRMIREHPGAVDVDQHDEPQESDLDFRRRLGR